MIAPLVEVERTPFAFVLQPGGGFVVKLHGREYRLESGYSYPHGGENRLVADAADTQGEASWRAATEKLDEKNYRVQARGQYYAIDRRLELEPTRIIVKDTIRNTSDDVVGIILANHINTRGHEGVKPTMMNKLTAFVHDERGGVGIIALDDLYQIQERSSFSDGLASLRTQHFGLDKGASYTVEWAVYPTATADYYDFINQVRKDEGLNRRVEGAFAFVPRRDPPTPETMDLLNLKYTSLGCLGKPPDDPDRLARRVRVHRVPRGMPAHQADVRRDEEALSRRSGHVPRRPRAVRLQRSRGAVSRLARAPGRRQADHVRRQRCQVLRAVFQQGAGGRGLALVHLLPDPGKPLRQGDDPGDRSTWSTNSGQRACGPTASSADTPTSTATTAYSYDRWDGHSVDIDPQTKLVTRKKTCVAWVSLPVLKKVVQIIAAKGGVTITNEGPDYPMSRSFWNEDIIASCEGSPDSVVALHLGRAPCSLEQRGHDGRGQLSRHPREARPRVAVLLVLAQHGP